MGATGLPTSRPSSAASLDRPGIDLQRPGRRLDGLVNISVGVGGGNHEGLTEHSPTQQLLDEKGAKSLRRLAIVILGRKHQT